MQKDEPQVPNNQGKRVVGQFEINLEIWAGLSEGFFSLMAGSTNTALTHLLGIILLAANAFCIQRPTPQRLHLEKW